MRLFLNFLFSIIVCTSFSAQELNAVVKVNYDQVRGSNNQVFTTLEKELTRYINTTKWTNQRYAVNERIDCNFSIIINKEEGTNDYTASILVQSRRPVYNSIYTSPIVTINDQKFRFKYVQFQPFAFSSTQFNGNLVDVVTYYVYLVLGYDADTYQKLGGTEWFKKAQTIVNNAQQQGYEGWNSSELGKNRYLLVTNLLSDNYLSVREMYYNYHRLGLDTMYDNPQASKQLIANNLLSLNQYVNNSAFSYSLDVFLDAKASEIAKIFSGGDNINTNIGQLKTLLTDLAPTKSDTWDKIK